MAGKLALDTNVVIALLDHDQSTIDFVDEYAEVFVPGIVLGELYFGAFRSARIQSNINKIEEFVASRPVIHCDNVTSIIYGEIKTQLINTGRPIPDNDIWIAAIAIQFDAEIASRDKHFNEIDELTVVVPPKSNRK